MDKRTGSGRERLEECLTYFRDRDVYEKVFQRFREKAASLGHFGGKVTLAALTPLEKEQLEGFFQKSFRNQKTVTISAALMQRALDASRFAGLGWEEILEAYYGEPLVGKREERRRQEEARARFFGQFLGEGSDQSGAEDPGQAWLRRALMEDSPGSRLLMAQYREDRQKLHMALSMALQAAKQLPAFCQAYETLPVFAAKITGNPHEFDTGTLGGRLLEAFLSDYFAIRREPGYSETEWKSRILYQAGILRDELSNTVMAYGIRGVRKDGMLHEGMEGFFRAGEPVVCTLLTLGNLADIQGSSQIYVVENPAVFSALIKRNPEMTFVCTNGQLRLASLVLLDFLKNHGILWYAGDFDPEGLLIAQNLKQRYGKMLRFWDYRLEYYQKAMSSVRLDEKRLRKLDGVKAEELQEIAGAIRETGRTAYQEAMLDWAYQL